MSATTWTIGSTDLATLGVSVMEEDGLLDLAGSDYSTHALRGRDLLSYQVRRRSYPRAALTVKLNAASAATLMTNWQALKVLVSPAVGWQSLTRSDVASKRLLVRGIDAPYPHSSGDGTLSLSTTLVFDRYPFWEDSSESTVVGNNLITNTGFETDTSTWVGSTGATLTRTTTAANVNNGVAALSVVTDGVDIRAASTPVTGGTSGMVVTAADTYRFGAYLRGNAGAESIRIRCQWYDSGGSALTIANEVNALTTSHVLYSFDAVAPVGAAFARTSISDNAASAKTFFVDDAFYYKLASSYTLTNPGNVAADCLWTATVVATMAGGLTFATSDGTFTYSAALVAGDIIEVDSALMTCYKNGSTAIASVATSSTFPRLLAGVNDITPGDNNFVLSCTYRAAYE